MRFILIILLVITSFSYAQDEKHMYTMLKTDVLTVAYGKNPNLSIEQYIAKRWAVEVGAGWMLHSWGYDGSSAEGQFFGTDGYKVYMGVRKYLGKKLLTPNAWFVSFRPTFRQHRIPHFDKYSTTTGAFEETWDQTELHAEANLMFGRQFLFSKDADRKFLNRLSIELYTGIGAGWFKQDYTVTQSLIGTEGSTGGTEKIGVRDPYIVLNLGYMIHRNVCDCPAWN